jgi:uncharacterized protein YbjT (DUF2867 family)
MPTNHKSILILGATGRTGLEIMRQLIAHPSMPQVHLFCRNPTKVPPDYLDVIASIQEGDARESTDLARALTHTKPTHVIVSIGMGDSVAKTDIRTASAQALARAMQTTHGMDEVQVIVVSSTGAGTSRIKVGMGVGKMIEYHLRHVLADHTGQEAAFLESGLADRTWIVRATSLTDDQAKGKVVTFGDIDKGPTVHVDRADVASYISEGIYQGNTGGRIDNITTPKKVKQ